MSGKRFPGIPAYSLNGGQLHQDFICKTPKLVLFFQNIRKICLVGSAAFIEPCGDLIDVVMLPSESFVKAISVVSRKEFSVCKLISDAMMTAIAAILSFVFWGELFGIREGTVITVILVGPISKIFTRRLGFTKHYFEHEGELVYEKKLKLQKEKPLIVTITSEAGSGGRDIARILGTKLNIPVYDKELIEMVAKEGDFKEGYVRRHNEVLYANPFQAFFLENYSLANENVESYRKLYETQCSVIRQLAARGDCIIVGHCSNYVLKDMADECCCVHILIGTDLRHRTEYMMKKYDISEAKALHRIRKQDTDTDVYYRHFTGINWKENGNYHLTIDSAAFGYEGTADVLDSIVRKRYMELPQVKIRETIRKYHRDE